MERQHRHGEAFGLTKCAGQLGLPHSIQRILREKQEVTNVPSAYWHAAPLTDEDPFEWHFTMKGPVDSEFEGGAYHGRIVLPRNYPYGPPCVMLLTQNGRFETGRKVCLSASNYHPELWQPAWGLRTMLDALHAFFPTDGEGALHALDWPKDVRRKIARDSGVWTCSVCRKSNAKIVEENCPKISEKRPALPDYIGRVPVRASEKVETSNHTHDSPTTGHEDTLRPPIPQSPLSSSTAPEEQSPTSSLSSALDHSSTKSRVTTELKDHSNSSSNENRTSVPPTELSRTVPKITCTNMFLLVLDLTMLAIGTCAILLIVHIFVSPS